MATKAPQTSLPPADPGKELTKEWIQYLKNNKIVKMQSDPKSGKLSYNRPVTTDDVSKFLIDTGKFDETTVNSAIQKAMAGKTTKTPTGTDMPTEPFTTPGAVVPGKDGKIPSTKTQGRTSEEPSEETVINPKSTPGPMPQGFTQVQLNRQGLKPEIRYIHKSQLQNWVNDGWTQSSGDGRVDVDAIGQYGWNSRTGKEFKSQEERDKFFKDAGVEDKRATAKQPQSQGGKKPGAMSQTPDAIRKRKQRAAAAQQGKSGQAAFSQMAGQLVKEDFQDQPGTAVGESDVERIFAALETPKPRRSQQSPKKPKVSPEEATKKKQEEVNKFKRIIRDTMTEPQRKALWRELNEI